MVIDMDTLCAGIFVFELGRLATFYKLAPEIDDEFESMFYGFPAGTCDYIWDRIRESLTDPSDRQMLAKIMVIGYLNLARIARHHFINEPETLDQATRHCAERIADFLPRLDSLCI